MEREGGRESVSKVAGRGVVDPKHFVESGGMLCGLVTSGNELGGGSLRVSTNL